MSRFGDDPQGFFEQVYAVAAPWDIGSPQQAMVELIERFPPTGPMLDLGCGSGDLAIHLAQLGYMVHGVDFVAAAIDQANAKRASLPPAVAERLTFTVSDATRPSALGEQFGAVFDSGFLHLLDAQESDRVVEEVSKVLAPDGRYYLHEFAIEFPIERAPRAVTEHEIRARFNERTGWRVLHLAAVTFASTVAQPTPAVVACVERIA